MARRFHTKVFKRYEDMLESDIDAVIVCSENVNHRLHAVVAAQHEKHVMCEKPLATTMQDAEAIVEVFKRSGVKLMPAFPCRFHPAYKRLKETVAEGHLGRILAVKATNKGKCPWGWFVDRTLSGGGAVLDQTVNIMDMIRSMTGVEATRVYAEIDNRRFNKDFDDTGIVSVDFSNGMFATIDASWSLPDSSPFWGNVNMDVIGTDGTARMDIFAQKIDLIFDKPSRFTYEYWGDNVDMAMVASFVKSIAEDAPVEVTGDDGVKALHVALAAYESAGNGRTIDFTE
jgi:predicted dehydrogenase